MEVLTKEEKKLTGSHYTPSDLSDFVANQILSAELKTHKMVI